jgi:uncharacterized membrane protein YqjE
VDLQAEPVPRAGPAAALRSLGATLTEIVAARVELAVVELREEGERRKSMLVLAATGGAFLALALLLATLFVLALYWDTHRLAAIGGMTLLYLAAGAGAIARMRFLAAAAPPPFEATLRELAADRELLGGRHE